MGRRNKYCKATKQISERERHAAQARLAAAEGADSEWPKSVTEWCAFRRVGRTTWYRWEALGLTPKVLQPAGPKGMKRVTREADTAWLELMYGPAPVPAEVKSSSTPKTHLGE